MFAEGLALLGGKLHQIAWLTSQGAAASSWPGARAATSVGVNQRFGNCACGTRDAPSRPDAGFVYDPSSLKQTGTFNTPLRDGCGRLASLAGTPSPPCSLAPPLTSVRRPSPPQLGHRRGERPRVRHHGRHAQALLHRRALPPEGNSGGCAGSSSRRTTPRAHSAQPRPPARPA